MVTLSNKVVFITGAARGIGAETARALADAAVDGKVDAREDLE